MTFSQKLMAYIQLMRWDSAAVTLLLMWPAMWSLWIAADGSPKIWMVAIFVAGSFIMSAAGCILNDIADREFDGHVARTKMRPLPAGTVTVKEAWIITLVLGFCALACLIPLNRLTWYLSLVAVFLSLTYPFMKRFFAIPQLYLGLAYAFGTMMAFAAVRGEIPLVAWLIYIGNIFWILGYDTTYAMADKPDDLKIGIKTSPIFFGKYDMAMVFVFDTLFLAMLLIVGVLIDGTLWYYLGIVAAALIMYGQYPIMKDRVRENFTIAFLNNKYVGFAIFIGIFLHYQFR